MEVEKKKKARRKPPDLWAEPLLVLSVKQASSKTSPPPGSSGHGCGDRQGGSCLPPCSTPIPHSTAVFQPAHTGLLLQPMHLHSSGAKGLLLAPSPHMRPHCTRQQQTNTHHLVFLAGLSGVWEREEAGLEKGDAVGPLFFHG